MLSPPVPLAGGLFSADGMCYSPGMPKIMIDVADEVDEKLREIARRNHRSKRMEVLAALDHYVNTFTSYVPVSTNSEETAA